MSPVAGGGPDRPLAQTCPRLPVPGSPGLSLARRACMRRETRRAAHAAGLSLLGLHRCVDDARVGRVPEAAASTEAARCNPRTWAQSRPSPQDGVSERGQSAKTPARLHAQRGVEGHRRDGRCPLHGHDRGADDRVPQAHEGSGRIGQGGQEPAGQAGPEGHRCRRHRRSAEGADMRCLFGGPDQRGRISVEVLQGERQARDPRRSDGQDGDGCQCRQGAGGPAVARRAAGEADRSPAGACDQDRARAEGAGRHACACGSGQGAKRHAEAEID